MKHKVLAVLAFILLADFASAGPAGGTKDKRAVRPSFGKELGEANLLTGIRSQNFGLRTSAAMLAGDIRSIKAVSALVDMLKRETDERARIVAALSLYKIGDPIGIYAVKQAARFDRSARVRKLCALFYLEYMKTAPEG
jgi:hypothetical protein